MRTSDGNECVAMYCWDTENQRWVRYAPGGVGLTDAQLRADPIEITGAVTAVGMFWPETQPVSGTFWQATQPVSGPLTDAQLRATAVPVSVGSLPKAREDAAAMAWVSAKNAAPSANSVQADTGALVAGDYDFDINLACADTVAVGKGLVIEHRNAANNATTHNLGACTPNGGSVQFRLRRYTIATNERLRVIAGTAAGAASSMYVSAIGRRIS